MGTAEEEEQASKEEEGEHQTPRCLLPSASLTGRLHCDIDVVVGEQLQQILIRGEIHLSATPIVFDDHSRSPIGGNRHAADLVLLNRLNKIAVAEGSCSGRRVRPVKEGRTHSDHNDHQKDVKADVAPTLVQGSLASDEGMLIEILRDQAARSTSTTLLKANHSGISSPLRSILRNWVPLSFLTCSPRVSACSAVT